MVRLRRRDGKHRPLSLRLTSPDNLLTPVSVLTHRDSQASLCMTQGGIIQLGPVGVG